MRSQARPFSVEIKSRKRSTPPAARHDWIDAIPPDDMPERDVREDLPDVTAQSEARREAERVFARLHREEPSPEAQTQPTPVKEPIPGSEARLPRVLPSLLNAAREEERTIEKPKRTRAPSSVARPAKVTLPKKPTSVRASVEQPQPEPSPSPQPPAPPASAQAAMSRNRKVTGKKSLPRGQRWKERRLPRLCWDR
jgi:hypothetical protein